MVLDVINNTKKNLIKYKPRSIIDIYKSDRPLVEFSTHMKRIDIQIKDFLKQYMYNNIKVLKNTNKGKKIIKDLFKYLVKNPTKFIDKKLLKKMKKERAVSDFIAGMTDRYAINLHKKIK